MVTIEALLLDMWNVIWRNIIIVHTYYVKTIFLMVMTGNMVVMQNDQIHLM